VTNGKGVGDARPRCCRRLIDGLCLGPSEQLLCLAETVGVDQRPRAARRQWQPGRELGGLVRRDADAIYSYEGTGEINTLIVGGAITGTSAFA
jgi:alkylation response protein AidB-like acyl-CoA dehydrogenase